MPATSRTAKLFRVVLLVAPTFCASASATEAARGAARDPGKANNTGAVSWMDPYPRAPSKNDPGFVGRHWRPGPKIGADRLEYLAQVPRGDTAAMPLIVVGAVGEDGLGAHAQLYKKATVIYIGPTLSSDADAGHNNWLAEKINTDAGPECSPTCSAWMFVPASAIREVLDDFARHVRFDHRRVQMFATNDSRYGIYRALDPVLQPYFAGVAHGVYAEWQQATCPDAAPPALSPPSIYFSWGGCDESFCPTMACMSSLKSKGYAIDTSSSGDTSPAACACPGSARVHILQAGTAIRSATYNWLLTNAREQERIGH